MFDPMDWIKNNMVKVLAIPAMLGGVEFLVNLFAASSDGIITLKELHGLVAVASPVQIIAIGFVMIALKKRSD